MDIAEFSMIRPLRDVEDEQQIRLTDTKVLIPQSDPPVNDDHVPPPVEPVTLTWATLPKKFGAKGVDPLASVGELKKSTSLLRRVYELVRRLDLYLAGHDDQVAGDRLAKAEAKLLEGLRLDDAGRKAAFGVAVEATALYAVALLGYRDALVKELSKQSADFDRAMKLTRRASVAALLEVDRPMLKGLTRDEVLDRLNLWPLVLDGVTSVQMSRTPKVELVREATKADLYVVRREWAGYVAGEIANVRNVMAGESFRQRDYTTTEVETTTTTEVETRQQTETEDETKVSSELSQEVNSQLGVTINGHAEASVEFKYPIATARISGGVDAGFSMQRSERQARKIAKETVSRAVSRVDSRTREARTRRELMRTEQGYTYTLDNSGGGNLHGVYRWVDRIDSYQTFKFPDRLLLEFQVPDPAAFYRWRTQHAADTAADKPPDWDLKPDDISLDDPDKLVELATTYRATNLPAPPDKEISVGRTVSVEVGKESEPSDWKTVLANPPTATKEVGIPITPNYEAHTISYEGIGYPLLAAWLDAPSHRQFPKDTDSYWGYRSGFLNVAVGSESNNHWNGGITGPGNPPNPVGWYGVDELQQSPDGHGGQKEIDYGPAILRITATEDVAVKPAARDEIKLAVTTSGLAQCTVTLLAKCTLTKEAQQAWRLTVYDTLYNAWASWQRDYDSSLMRNVFGSLSADAGSTQRNELTIREELKRETISWLLDESPFKGRPGRKKTTTNDFDDVDSATARRDAPTIQFLEQAFEWNNMSWVFYPYYWADRQTQWPELAQLQANDPEFERFLRSGSARVILPARPGFNDAVNNWLATGKPFLSGRLPAPDEDLYIRIDTEIRELTSPREGGYAGDHWQSQVSTTMLYLEEKGDLPFINDLHQLPAPAGEWYTPKPIVTFT